MATKRLMEWFRNLNAEEVMKNMKTVIDFAKDAYKRVEGRSWRSTPAKKPAAGEDVGNNEGEDNRMAVLILFLAFIVAVFGVLVVMECREGDSGGDGNDNGGDGNDNGGDVDDNGGEVSGVDDGGTGGGGDGDDNGGDDGDDNGGDGDDHGGEGGGVDDGGVDGQSGGGENGGAAGGADAVNGGSGVGRRTNLFGRDVVGLRIVLDQ